MPTLKQLLDEYKKLKHEIKTFFEVKIGEYNDNYNYQLIPYETKHGTRYSLVYFYYDKINKKMRPRSLGPLHKLGLNVDEVVEVLNKQTRMFRIRTQIMKMKNVKSILDWEKRGRERKLRNI